jgi:uncharacterized protein (DUF2147 family)
MGREDAEDIKMGLEYLYSCCIRAWERLRRVRMTMLGSRDGEWCGICNVCCSSGQIYSIKMTPVDAVRNEHTGLE